MRLNKLVSINGGIDNVSFVDVPSYYLLEENLVVSKPKMAVFFGADFLDIPDDIDVKRYIEITNKCLDYVRRECADCELFYKPHPSETRETSFLNLKSFKIIEQSGISEIFLWKNVGSIRYAFSAYSTSSSSAFALGINAYVFSWNLFGNAIKEDMREFLKILYDRLPKRFFINDFNQRLPLNLTDLKRDYVLERKLESILNRKNGRIWFVLSDPGLSVFLLSFLKAIRRIGINNPANLIIYRHHRWDVVDMNDIKSDFDKVLIFPRLFYSLKLVKLWEMLKVARAVKKMNFGMEDVLISFNQSVFLENCILSYHPQLKSVAVMTKTTFDFCYDTCNINFCREKEFQFTKASFVYNKIIEPILRLNRTLFLHSGNKNLFNVTRYQRPINEIFTDVVILNFPGPK